MYDSAPWSIQRRRALDLIQYFEWQTYLFSHRVMQECTWLDLQERSRGLTAEDWDHYMPAHFDETQHHAAWLRWREGLIHRYCLEEIVRAYPSKDSETGSV